MKLKHLQAYSSFFEDKALYLSCNIYNLEWSIDRGSHLVKFILPQDNFTVLGCDFMVRTDSSSGLMIAHGQYNIDNDFNIISI